MGNQEDAELLLVCRPSAQNLVLCFLQPRFWITSV